MFILKAYLVIMWSKTGIIPIIHLNARKVRGEEKKRHVKANRE